MRKLPNDISRCMNKECPLKEKCLRYIDIPEGEVGLYSMFKPEGKNCINQIKFKK